MSAQSGHGGQEVVLGAPGRELQLLLWQLPGVQTTPPSDGVLLGCVGNVLMTKLLARAWQQTPAATRPGSVSVSSFVPHKILSCLCTSK